MPYSLQNPDPRWRWAYDPDDTGAPAYRIRGAAPGAKGSIAIWMPDATFEDFEELRRRLVKRFNPAFEVPATRIMGKVDRLEGRDMLPP
ncbi:hypothetical protein [Nitrobacter sp.]|uniref:hypothetical protein n=1 Tax=Nitrobacter sp. TaxID=29420 RepID=UPI0029CAB7CB|nr:hypothetical protein [Nitrobacter sp.]